MPEHRFFKSIFFHFEYLRLLHAAPFEASEVGESLEALEHIKEDDPESWYRAWNTAAAKAEAIGAEAQAFGHKDAARRAFLSAANYHRSSEFMLHCNPSDPRLLQAMEKSVSNFRKGASLLDGGVHFVEIPYENGLTLPGYLYLPPESKRLGGKIPIVIGNGGLDSTQEELYHFIAAGARTRGYAALTFEGPGQGICLRRDGTSLRPDWEAVTSKVLDHLFKYSDEHPELDLDTNRIAIAGASLGGYLVLRAAADHRIKACISLDGFYDLHEAASQRPGFWLNDWLSDGVFNSLFNLLASTNFQARWETRHGMWAFGVPTPADVVREMRRYTLKLPGGEEYLQKIKCPMLITAAESSLYFPPVINEKIYGKLTQLKDSQKKLWVGKGLGQGGLQAKVGALGFLHHQMYSWLDEQFGVQRSPISDKF